MREKNNRKDFSTRVDIDLYLEFKARCAENNHTLSEVLEAFMTMYNSGEYILEKQPKYKAIRSV